MTTATQPTLGTNSGIDELPKILLKQRAYDALKRRIQEAVLEPGTFLSERQLAAQLGMSKTPVKAALERLEAEGFIAVSPQQGIVVLDLSIHEIADQFEIRLALESFVLRSIAGRLSDDQACRVHKNLESQQQAAESEDISASVELDAEFHALFCEFMGNREIVRVMSRLRERIHRVITRVFGQDVSRLAVSLEEHRRIAEAVLNGNPDRAAEAIEEHLQYGKQQLLSPRRR
jgi:DNA-binding GntR family transcriptional regulator